MAKLDHLSSLKRGLRTLALLNQRRQITGSQLARALGLPRTTAARILDTLEGEGYIERDVVSRVFTVTGKVLQLSSGFDGESRIAVAAKPLLQELCIQVSWPLALSTPMGEEMLVRVATDHNAPRSIERYHAGSTTPLLYCSTGQCYLAYCDLNERQLILELLKRSTDPRQSLAKNTRLLASVMKKIRSDGYRIVEYDEHPEACLGVPLFFDNKLVGGLVMRYVKLAITPIELRTHYFPLLRKYSDKIAANAAQRV